MVFPRPHPPTVSRVVRRGGLELAQKRLQDVTTDLDNFDKRMDDLLHIATNFNYPEDRWSVWEPFSEDVEVSIAMGVPQHGWFRMENPY